MSTDKDSTATIEPVPSREAEMIKAVDPNNVYRARLQLGDSRRWRQFGGGEWKETGRDNRGRDGEQRISYQMIPALHEIGPYSGLLMNGLISAHNKWVAANKDQAGPEGTVNRMLIISNVEEVDELAQDDVNTRRGGAGSANEQMLQRVITTTIKEVLTALGAVPKQGRSTGSK